MWDEGHSFADRTQAKMNDRLHDSAQETLGGIHRRGLILVINAGSSSLKFDVFALEEGVLRDEIRGQIDGIGSHAKANIRSADGSVLLYEDLNHARITDSEAALVWLLVWLDKQLAGRNLIAVGHRVVHGGVEHSAPIRISSEVLASLDGLVALAPLHQPSSLAVIRSLSATWPDLPQVACFDTAFHRTQPMVAELFGLPKRFFDEGVRRYGFHGLSYEYIVRRLRVVAPEAAAARTVVAHLGNGASMCALRDGRSIASTMGFTALDGCLMGTRPGSLDAGVVLYLAKERGMSLVDIETLLYKQSGLLGLSGISSDMRELAGDNSAAAQLAIHSFVYRVGRELGSLAAALGGLDALVFTGGIGENSQSIRASVCEGAAWLGVELDPAANRTAALRISAQPSKVSVWRIPTNEELMIAEHTCQVLALI